MTADSFKDFLLLVLAGIIAGIIFEVANQLILKKV